MTATAGTATAGSSEKAWSLEIDTTKLFSVLAKIAVDGTLGTLVGAIKSALDLPSVAGAEQPPERTPGEQCWLLVHRSLMLAMAWTIRDNQGELSPLATRPDTAPFLRKLLPAGPFEITPEFLDRPAESTVFEAILPQFAAWLELLGLPPERRERLCSTLAAEFPLALEAEARIRRKEYEGFSAFFAPTPFDAPARRERDWRGYHAALVSEVRDRPLFNLAPEAPGAVTLSDVYIPLRAYWEERPPEPADKRGADAAPPKQPVRVVVWLAEALRRWLDQGTAADSVRIVSGEPGCGKSSFARMFAAELAREGRRVLYVPLHRFDFQGDAKAALAAFCPLPDELGHNPLETVGEGVPLLLIFDGLDELSRSGQSAADAAKAFVEHLARVVDCHNGGRRRLLVLLAGRWSPPRAPRFTAMASSSSTSSAT